MCVLCVHRGYCISHKDQSATVQTPHACIARTHIRLSECGMCGRKLEVVVGRFVLFRVKLLTRLRLTTPTNQANT